MTKQLQKPPSITISRIEICPSEEDTQVTITGSLSLSLDTSKFPSPSSSFPGSLIFLPSLNFKNTTNGALVNCSFEVRFLPPFSPPDTSLGG